MLRLRHDALPFRGSSHHFVGADYADVNVSVFLFNGAPVAGPAPHRHPYDEVQSIQSGRGRWNVVKGADDDSCLRDALVRRMMEADSEAQSPILHCLRVWHFAAA